MLHETEEELSLSIKAFVEEKKASTHPFNKDAISALFDSTLPKRDEQDTTTYAMPSESGSLHQHPLHEEERGLTEENDSYPSVVSDSLQLYIRDISQHPLLKKEEEISLAKEIALGSETAKDKLICSNLRLVVNIARKYQSNKKFDLLELIQEGNTGLLRAAERYNHELGYRFTTFAYWWIRHAIMHYIGETRTIRLTTDVVRLVKKYKQAANALTSINGIEPTIDEIADVIHVDKKKIQKAMFYHQETKTISLSSKMSMNKDELVLEDFIEDDHENVFEKISTKFTNEMIDEILGDLKEREELVLRLRFGFDDGKPRTLEDIGKILGVTRERIRQIEQQAIKQIRRHRLIHSLTRMQDSFSETKKAIV